MFSIQIINLSELSIYLMEMKDTDLQLYASNCNQTELEKSLFIRHPQKRLEFLASRSLKNSIFPNSELLFDSTGGPYIKGEGFLSLSHNKSYVALIHSREFRVGIDLECIREKAMQVSSRFCSGEESEFFDQTSPRDMSLLWSYKETLFKLSDRVGLSLINDIHVYKNGQKTLGSVKFSDSTRHFELEYIEQNNNFITFNSTKGRLL